MRSPHVRAAHDGPARCIAPVTFERCLLSGAPRKRYQRRQADSFRAQEWGQRKLLLVEMEFLVKYAQEGDLVVYAGAAPGTHIPVLLDAFPSLRFELYDASPFHESLETHPRVVARRELFTREVAEQYSRRADAQGGRRPLFLSDIRSADPERDGRREHEEKVLRDMLDQQQWHMIMRPAKSLLKLRFPYPDVLRGSTTYLAGDVYLQPFAPGSSTETRLVPHDDMHTMPWDHTAYEERM